jgi:hypothetical protein
MKTYILTNACLVFILTAFSTITAQVAAVNFRVHTPVIAGQNNGVYLAGSFNGWKANDTLYRMKETGNSIYSITIPVFDNKPYQYKYTLGSWDGVEVAGNDSNISNRHFVSFDKLTITDTVAKWKQVTGTAKDSSAHLKRLAAMKDSVLEKLKPEVAELTGLLKLYIQNMLLQNPDTAIHRQLDQAAAEKIAGAFKQITQLLWDIVASLSPEQKQQVSKVLSQPSSEDFINAFLSAVNNAVK